MDNCGKDFRTFESRVVGVGDSAEVYAVVSLNIYHLPFIKKNCVSERWDFMTLEEVLIEKFKVLPMNRKQQVLDFVEFLESRENVKKPRVSLKGILADLEINITEEDIREARNEMWRGYTEDTENEK